MAKKKIVTDEVVVAEQPTMASGVEQDATAPEIDAPAPKQEKAKKPKAEITLEDLCARYIAHLDEVGKSQGTQFSYRLELTTALDVLGKETPLSTLTSARVLEFNTCDRVMKTKTGVAKARPTFLKTQRVLRLALVFAQESGLIERAPLPEDAASYDMERYDVGDRVLSNVDAQGMKRGERFEVIGREERWVLGNCYATLTLRSEEGGRELHIVNGQLLLSRAN